MSPQRKFECKQIMRRAIQDGISEHFTTTEKSKKKGKLIKDKINKNLEKSGIKEKYKKLDSKKTLKDLFKKE